MTRAGVDRARVAVVADGRDARVARTDLIVRAVVVRRATAGDRRMNATVARARVHRADVPVIADGGDACVVVAHFVIRTVVVRRATPRDRSVDTAVTRAGVDRARVAVVADGRDARVARTDLIVRAVVVRRATAGAESFVHRAVAVVVLAVAELRRAGVNRRVIVVAVSSAETEHHRRGDLIALAGPTDLESNLDELGASLLILRRGQASARFLDALRRDDTVAVAVDERDDHLDGDLEVGVVGGRRDRGVGAAADLFRSVRALRNFAGHGEKSYCQRNQTETREAFHGFPPSWRHHSHTNHLPSGQEKSSHAPTEQPNADVWHGALVRSVR